MGKFRHTFRRWRSAILREQGNVELPPQFPLPNLANEPPDEPRNLHLEPLLDLSTMAINETWKDLPQEIIDHILFMLSGDLQSLKACSLTCKTMFISTRRFIHRKIRLTGEQNWDVLTLREKQRYIREDRQGIAVKVLCGIAAHGLFPYGRHLFISLNKNFTPVNLQPFNDHFQRFDRIQELSIYGLHTEEFLEEFDTFFANFVPTLRSLHLDTPTGDGRDVLDFVCRFPHLDNLTFRMPGVGFDGLGARESEPLPVVKKVPPFRGSLKFRESWEFHGHVLLQLFSLPGKRRFRFVDLRSCPSEVEQPIIDACSGTIEALSFTWRKSRGNGPPLNLLDVRNLRSFTLRVFFDQIGSLYEVLSQTLHTIISPFFSEFVLEVESVYKIYGPTRSTSTRWGTWTKLDEMFERIDVERGFRLVIRAEKAGEGTNFMEQAKDRFPLMDARERLVFEIGRFSEDRFNMS